MKEIVCIVCPRGCHLKVDEENGYKVSGNSCAKGAEYGKAELQNPTRVLTTTVRLEGCGIKRCPVKTSVPIPKSLQMDVMRLMDSVVLRAPVRVGQIVIPDVLGTGSSIVVTRSIE